MQKVRERAAAIETELLFFELEWNEVDDELAAELLASDELERWRHHLTNLRRTARTSSPSRRSGC